MTDVKIPKLGMSTVEVDVAKWLVGVGARVAVGTPLVEVETEKATVEVEAEVAGVVTDILVAAGATTEVGAVICRIREDDNI